MFGMKFFCDIIFIIIVCEISDLQYFCGVIPCLKCNAFVV